MTPPSTHGGSPGPRLDPTRHLQLHGPLFEAVQEGGVFSDSKTFPDCVARSDPAEILAAFERRRGEPGFDLRAFVLEHFDVPAETSAGEPPERSPERSMEEHVEALWHHLSREPDPGAPVAPNGSGPDEPACSEPSPSPRSTLLPLPHSYVVPGGRFREIYYWDSYFTALGLAASGRRQLVEGLARNLAHLVDLAGFVPNGNRVYYLSRSQPPFLAPLVELLAELPGGPDPRTFLPRLRREHDFWMDGSSVPSDGEPEPGRARRRVVRGPGTGGKGPGAWTLNRHWDDRAEPRPESWREDRALAREIPAAERPALHRQVRAACESGWDFSSRWLGDGGDLRTLRTTDILPLDLNALLYHLEAKLAEWEEEPGQRQSFRRAAEARRAAYETVFWHEEEGFYFDHDLATGRPTGVVSAAAAYPLYFGLASDGQAAAVAQRLEAELLRPGGLMTTTVETGQQWDAPNGWAPLQWLAVRGLERYGHRHLAQEIARRWLELNRRVYRRTGRMMEKYDVCDPERQAGGGEYPNQDGFGWTNGVAVALGRWLG